MHVPSVIAVIPARGGSKGIRRKNLRQIAGITLVEHSIRHAQACQTIERVIVSTEDEEIAETALRAGAEVPFMRPQELAGDSVLDWPVFDHALRFLEENDGYLPDAIVHLRPTTPYRKTGWIDEAVSLLLKRPGADSVRSVSPVIQHPYRMFSILPDGFLDPIMKHEHPEPYLLRRQELPPLFYYNCVIDVVWRRTIFDQKSMTGKRIFPFMMDADDVLDIDTLRDLEFAQFLMEGKK